MYVLLPPTLPPSLSSLTNINKACWMTRTSFSATTPPVTVAHFCPAQTSVPGACRRSALAATRLVGLFLRSREWGTSSAPRGEVLAVDGDASVGGASDPPASSSAAIWRGRHLAEVRCSDGEAAPQSRAAQGRPVGKKESFSQFEPWSPPMHRHLERVHLVDAYS